MATNDGIEDLLAGGADVDDLIVAGWLDDQWESPQEKAEREAQVEADSAYASAYIEEAEKAGNIVSF